MGFFRQLLKKNILLLLSAQVISVVGSVMQTFALSLYVLENVKTNNELAFGSVLAISVLPRLLGPFSGVVVDRVDRKRLLILLDLAAGLFTLGFAFWHRYVQALPLSCVYCMVLLLSVVQTAYDPTVTAIIPELTDKSTLKATNIASSFVAGTSVIIGPVLASVLSPGSRTGILIIMLINSGSFFIAAVFELFLKNKSTLSAVKAAGESVIASIKEGFATIFGNRELVAMLILSVIVNFALYSVISVGIVLIMYKDVGVSNELIGLSKSFMYVGPILGSVVAGLFLKKIDYRKLLIRILFFNGVLLAFMAAVLIMAPLTGSSRIAVQFTSINISALFIMSTVVLGSIAITTTMQQIVPGHLMGRVSAVDASCSVISIPIGQMLFSLLSRSLNSGITLLTFSAVILSAAVLARFLYKPMLQHGLPAAREPAEGDGQGTLSG